MQTREEYKAQEQAKADALFAGKTIRTIEVRTSSDRTDYLVFHFDDGSAASVGYWASYADDASLDFGPHEEGSG